MSSAHVRTQIRDAVVTALTGLTFSGSNVFAARVTQLQPDELPALLIDTADEEIKLNSLAGGRNALIDRTLTLTVRVVVKEADSYEDDMDEGVRQVEAAIATDPTLGGLCKYAVLTGIEIERDGDGDLPTVKATMNYSCSYITTLNAPQTPL